MNADNFQVKEVQNPRDIVTISVIIKKFFDKVNPDYKYTDFLKRLYYAISDENSKIVYITDVNNGKEKPIAYLVATIVEDVVGPAVLIFQAYSERPLLSKRMLKIVDNWSRSKGVTRQFILATRENEKHFEMNYGFKTKYIYMGRVLEENDKEENLSMQNGEEKNGRTILLPTS